ncbi:hypothetical protein Esti_003259 [Eimeria stiedai]
MGNLETSLVSDVAPSSAAANTRAPSAPAGGAPSDAGCAQKKTCFGADGHRGNSGNPGALHQTEATSIPLSVPEVESETDVGAPSPSPENKSSWAPFSPPEDMDVLCPTPYQSSCVDQGPAQGGPCNMSGSENHLSCFEEAVGRALAGNGWSEKETSASGGPYTCPHLAAAAREGERAFPPSLLALGEIIKSSMGAPQISGLHPNSPSASPRWHHIPAPPQGSPVGEVEGAPKGLPRVKQLNADAKTTPPRTPPPPPAPSARDASTETSGGILGGPSWPVESCKLYTDAEGRNQQHLKTTERQLAEQSTPKEGQEEALVSVCCSHIVSMQGRLGTNNSNGSNNKNKNNNTNNNNSTAECPLEALQQLSPRLHECAEALSRTLLLQAANSGGASPGESPLKGAPIAGLPSLGPPLSDTSLREVAVRLSRLQSSIDQFTSVLSRCEGRLFSALYGGPFRGSTSMVPPVNQVGAPRGSYIEAVGLVEGGPSESGAPTRSDTTRAQQGSPLAYRDGDEEGPLTPVFFINREPTTPFGDREGAAPEHSKAVDSEGASNLQQSSAAMQDSFASLLKVPPSMGFSEGPRAEADHQKNGKRGTGKGAFKGARDRLKAQNNAFASVSNDFVALRERVVFVC